MSSSSGRAATLILRWCLVGAAAIGVGSLLIHPPRALRKPKEECWLSGRVTSQGRLVGRGVIRFCCIMREADPPRDELFPDVTVQIANGAYEASHLEGLVPGSYYAAIKILELAADGDGRPRSSGSRPHRPEQLIGVKGGVRTVLDLDL